MRARLDVWLVERGLAESREKAQALVMAGRVRVDGLAAAKPGTAVATGAQVEILPGPRHVGRGARKLEGALDAFSVDPAGRVAVDVGASTGGFTEVLVARGARRVYAVDVGRGQLHERLRRDPRVVVRERVNARHLSAADVPEPCGLATVDVSFISVLKVLPALRGVLSPEADVIALVKPQFEVGRAQVGRGGLVRDPALHGDVLAGVAARARGELAYAVVGACPSPITGAEGNREFFLHLRPGGPGLGAHELEEAMRKVARS
ncbi:MAG TPA: TlyA family RNA methyltransferase [Vicinamibacteria bacterium]|nr:TlyA family RNA methyltransferase [Vicinamibacteria bacterium]